MVSLLLNAAVCGVFLFFSSSGPGWRWAALIALAVLTLQALRLFRQSRKDALTGLWNLRRLEDMARIYRRCRKLGVWYFDLDHLKNINDTEGHTAGDRRLKGFAATLRAAARREAMAYRVGGDEFLLIVPNPDGCTPPLPDTAELSASWGYAEGEGKKLRQLSAQAEQEMYRRRGRDIAEN